MARPEKVAQVDAVRAIFDEARSIVLNDFTGLDVEKISELRRLCRESNVGFRVVKNTLAKRGLEGTPAEELVAQFEGPTALAYSNEAEHIPAKVLAKFAEEHSAPKFKAGYVEGKIVDINTIIALSKLPSREELMSSILGGIQAPGSGLVACLQGPLRNLVSVLGQIKDQKAS